MNEEKKTMNGMRLRHIILFLLMAVFVTPIRAGILTDYLLGGALTLKNGRIDKYYFEGGFARTFETSATTDRFVFYYYNQNHLGNNREVVDIKGRIYQVTNITKATKDYVVGKAVGLLNRKTVNPTSNNKAVKTAMERAKIA